MDAAHLHMEIITHRAVERAMSGIAPQLDRAREQAEAGIAAGIAAARAGDPLPSQAQDEDTWWATGAVAGYRAAREAAAPPQPHYHGTSGMEDTPCLCPSPGTYAPQW